MPAIGKDLSDSSIVKSKLNVLAWICISILTHFWPSLWFEYWKQNTYLKSRVDITSSFGFSKIISLPSKKHSHSQQFQAASHYFLATCHPYYMKIEVFHLGNNYHIGPSNSFFLEWRNIFKRASMQLSCRIVLFPWHIVTVPNFVRPALGVI